MRACVCSSGKRKERKNKEPKIHICSTEIIIIILIIIGQAVSHLVPDLRDEKKKKKKDLLFFFFLFVCLFAIVKKSLVSKNKFSS